METSWTLPVPKHKFSDLYLCFCGYEACQPLHSYGPAVRPNYVIHYIISGKGTFTIGTRTYRFIAGQGFFQMPNVSTYYEADADDIAQETMVKLYLNIDALDEDRVEGWVRVAAKNLGIDYQRKAQRFDWNELDEDLRAEEMELPTLAEEEKQERNHFFREVMDALKDHDESGYYITREIKVHERSEKEVASEMGITIGNLRVKMTRTKKWLCQHFADKARERGFL